MRGALAIICGGVTACSLLSGASELRVGEVGEEGLPGRDASDDAVLADGFVNADADAELDSAVILPDGAIVPPGGRADTTFGTGGRVLIDFGAAETCRALTVEPSGVIVAAGRTGSNIPTNFAIARLTPTGALDPTFGSGGKMTVDFASDFDEVSGLSLRSDGHYIATGRAWNSAKGGFVVASALLQAGGGLATTFGDQGRLEYGIADGNNQDGTFAAVLRPGDKPVVAGSTGGNVVITGFDSTGAIDPAAGGGGGGGPNVGAAGVVRGLALQSDGKFLLAGWTPPYSEAVASDVIIERRLSSRVLDSNFGAGGRVTLDVGTLDHLYGVAAAAGGKVVVAGDTNMAGNVDVLVMRLDANGALDGTFGTGGRVVTAIGNASEDRGRAVAIDAQGRILVAGSTNARGDDDVLLLRYDANGVLDQTFGTLGIVITQAAGKDEARVIRLMLDGRIVIGGVASDDMVVQRFLP